MAVSKQIQVKVYDRRNVLKLTATDITLGGFDKTINGGLGQLNLTLARPIDNFGEGSEIDLKFLIEVRVIDRETTPLGKLIYSGYIEKYRQIVSGNRERIEIQAMGWQAQFAKRIHQSSSATTVSYTSRDPSYMLTDVIAKMAGRITTSAASIENTGLSLSYTFRNNTIKEVLDKIIDLSPAGFYWTVDALNILYFRLVNLNKPDHVLQFGKAVTSIEIEKSIDKMVNTIYFVGGGNPNLFRKSVRQSGIDEWDKWEERVSDERVTVTNTADQIATNKLDRFDHPSATIRVTLADSNLSNSPDSGFDIESFQPGQVIVIRNLASEQNTLWDQASWDVDFWDFNFLGVLAGPFIINKVSYNYYSATLELGEFSDIFGRDFKKLEDKVSTSQYENLPATPTTV